eukprot:Clim_evm39s149 gene=Clim_evmTU39s149
MASSYQSIGGMDNTTEQDRISKYETRLPFKLEVLAAGAYALGPISGLTLLILEHKNDYVRFHAWQSVLTLGIMLLLHLIFIWSTVMSWLLFVGDLCLIGWLGYNAYIESDALNRYKVPYIGDIAERWVEEE